MAGTYQYDAPQSESSDTTWRSRYKFTGKERDSESGLDNFGARYDSAGKQRRLGTSKACVAVANKNARIVWSLIAREESYRRAA